MLIIRNLNYFTHDSQEPGGEAMLIECDGKFGMVDAGGAASLFKRQSNIDKGIEGTPENMIAENNIVAQMELLGVKQLEFFIQTHYHYDHSWITPDIIRCFRPKVFYAIKPEHIVLTPIEYSKTAANYWDTPTFIKRIEEALSEVDLQITEPEEDQVIYLGSATLRFVNTHAYTTKDGKSDHNNASIGFVLTHGAVKVAMFGDAAWETLDYMVDKVGKINLAYQSHHGYTGNTSPKTIYTLAPEYYPFTRFKWIDNNSNIASGRIQELVGSKVLAMSHAGSEPMTFISDGENIKVQAGVVEIKYINEFYKWSLKGGDGKDDWVYFGEDGRCVTDKWVQYHEKSFYINSDKFMYRGWLKTENNERYYLSEGTQESFNKNNTFSDGEKHINNWINEGGHWYWLKADGKMAKDEIVLLNGRSFIFESNGQCLNFNL